MHTSGNGLIVQEGGRGGGGLVARFEVPDGWTAQAYSC